MVYHSPHKVKYREQSKADGGEATIARDVGGQSRTERMSEHARTEVRAAREFAERRRDYLLDIVSYLCI